MRGSREEETGVFLGSPASECIRIGDLSFDEERSSLRTIRGEQFEKKASQVKGRHGAGDSLCERQWNNCSIGTIVPLGQWNSVAVLCVPGSTCNHTRKSLALLL